MYDISDIYVYIGQQWGALENINYFVFRLSQKYILKEIGKLHASSTSTSQQIDTDPTKATPDTATTATTATINDRIETLKAEQQQYCERIIRYSRLNMMLTFLAAQGRDDFSLLEELQLLTNEEEKEYLKAATIGTRPLVVVVWISEYLDEVQQRYSADFSTSFNLVNNVTNLR